MRSALVLSRVVLAAGLCAGCGDEPRQTQQLPGALFVVEGTALVRYAAGARTELGVELFPSAHRLPDGRLVAIASRGDGSADAEQLALVAADARVERVGPAAMQVRDPAVDPRGRWIVIAANLDGHSDLYRVTLGAGQGDPRSGTERLTNDVAGNFHPVLAGDSIVYVSSRDGDAELYRDSQRLTAFHRDDWQPTPSPRGNTLAFLSDREGPPRIFLMAPDGTSLRRLTSRTDAAGEDAPVWSPDARFIAYTVAGTVWLHELATGAARALTPIGALDHEPAFSPDGRWLAVARSGADGHDTAVWAIPLAGGEPVELARNARLPRWF